jgi:membrane fusion protein, multidrug efflux system
MVEAQAMKHSPWFFIVGLLACNRQPGADPEAGIQTASLAAAPAALATADTATLEVPLILPSQLYVERDATIYARSGGIVQSIMVDLGSRVAAGQPLARLESTDQEIALAQAREKFTNTRQMVERQRALKVAGVVTQADSERVEFEHREAVLTLRKAQREYDLTRILAPFAGVVTARMARLHQLVGTGDSLFRLTALRPVLAAVRVPESSSATVGIGSTAEVVGPGGVSATAKVIRASPVLDAGSGTREMILQLTNHSRLTPGSNVTVRLGTERRRVVAIPRSAVAQEGYAMVWANDKTVLRPVTLGRQIGEDLVEVVSGLAAGEKILRALP